MIDYAEALRRVLESAKPGGFESVPLVDAQGRTLARDIRAGEDVPPFSKAAMDGYAVRAEDTEAAAKGGLVELEVLKDLPAGRVSRKAVGPGRAIRIMTGAPLPKGADAVVMVEDTEKIGPKVRIRKAVRPGDNIGFAGEDLKKGDLVLERGTTVGPAELGMLAALNRARVPVSRRPRLAVIATGDEIVEPGERKARGQIRNSNGYALLAAARGAGAEASYLGIARDTGDSLKAKIGQAAKADIMVLTGGVSVGDYDLVKDKLGEMGVRTIFWRVKIKPGKPVFFGGRKKQLVFGLPGNPTSALVTFQLFVRPAVDRILGRASPGLRGGKAMLGADVDGKPGLTRFLRGVLSAEGAVLKAAPYADQRSGVLRSMVRSRILIVVPAEISRLAAGAEVEILFLEGC